MFKQIEKKMVYSEETWQKLLDQLSGGQTLTSICQASNMPSMKAVFKKQSLEQDFFERYAEARDCFAQHHADSCLGIADDADEVLASVNKADLRIRTRQWLSNINCPTRFSDRRAINVRKLKAKQKVEEQVNTVIDELACGAMSPEDATKVLTSINLGQSIKREHELEQRVKELETAKE